MAGQALHRNNGPKQGGGNKGKKSGGKHRNELMPFLEPMTRKVYHQDLKSQLHLAFKPQQRELGGEVRAEKELRHRIRPYFNTYLSAVDNARQNEGNAYSAAVAAANQAGANASATDQRVRSQIESQAAADAAMRGATYTPSTQSADASANRQDSAALIAGVIAGQGANQQAYLSDKSRIGKGEMLDQLLKSHARSRSLDSDKRALATQKRDFARDFYDRARDAAIQRDLQEQQIATTRRGQKVTRKDAKLSAATSRRGQNITRAHNAAMEATAQQNANTSAQNAQTSAKNAKTNAQNVAHDNRHPSSSSSGGSGKNVQSAVAYLRNYGNSLDPKEQKNFGRQQGIDYLVAHGYPRSVAVKALDRLTGGGSTPGHTSPNAALHGG